MQKIITFITFNNQAEEAVNLYTSVFKIQKSPVLTVTEMAHLFRKEL